MGMGEAARVFQGGNSGSEKVSPMTPWNDPPIRRRDKIVIEIIGWSLMVVVFVIVMMFIGAAVTKPAHGHDNGQWEASDPVIREWYRGLMRPDAPGASCCGVADAYWADEVHVRDGKTYATITDDRPDEPLGRPHLPSGTEIEIPNDKLKWDRGNPTGHSVLFVSKGLFVWCFVQAGGA